MNRISLLYQISIVFLLIIVSMYSILWLSIISIVLGLMLFHIGRELSNYKLFDSQIMEMLNRTNTLFSLKKMDGTFVRLNPLAMKAFGINDDQIPGVKELDIESKEWKTFNEEMDQDILNKMLHIERETCFERQDGATDCYSVLKFPVLDKNGNISEICTIATDITQRSLDEKKLRNFEEQNRLMLNLVGEGIFVTTNKGKMTFINKSVIEQLVYFKDRLLGKGVHSLIHLSHLDGLEYPVEEFPMSHTDTYGNPAFVREEVLCPEAIAEEDNVANLSSQSKSLKDLTVLLAEDNEMNQEIAIELLTGKGIKLDVVWDGNEVISLADKLFTSGKMPDIILMDLQMPNKGGLEATRELRADSRFKDIPILAMTAQVMSEEVEECLNAGMNGHIAKPIEPDHLFDMLHKFSPSRLKSGNIELPCETEKREQEGNRSRKIKEEKTEIEISKPIDLKAMQENEISKLSLVEGLNVKAGLRRVEKNEKLYLSLLTKFIDGQIDATEKIEKHILSGDLNTAERIAHTLKGVAGNIGAEKLQKLAETVEKSLKSEEASKEMMKHIEILTKSLGSFIKDLKNNLCEANEEPIKSNGTYSDDEIQNVLSNIMELLKESDVEALDLFQTNQNLICLVLTGEQFKKTKNYIEAFEFDEAYEILSSLKMVDS